MNVEEVQTRKRILILEEEVDFALLTRTYFTRKNDEVFIVHTFLEALSRAAELQPDHIYLSSINGLPYNVASNKLRQAAPNAQIHISKDFHRRLDE